MQGNELLIKDLWNRRHTTKFNGVSYVTQRGAAAIYSAEGKEQISKRRLLYDKCEDYP